MGGKGSRDVIKSVRALKDEGEEDEKEISYETAMFS
jgi:hypothetical protein